MVIYYSAQRLFRERFWLSAVFPRDASRVTLNPETGLIDGLLTLSVLSLCLRFKRDSEGSVKKPQPPRI